MIRRVIVGTCLALGSVGCATKNPLDFKLPNPLDAKWIRGNGFTGESAKLGEGLRDPDPYAPKGTGIDERARQIERNLGYR